MWFNIQARAGVGEISIFGEIGSGGVTAGKFAADLKALKDVHQILLRINSAGGECFAGLAIYNMLSRHKARKIVTIDGVAASIASVIAMAGDMIIMPENACMMLHEASMVKVTGTAEELRTHAEGIDRINASMVGIYALRTRQSPEKIAAMLKAETWLSAKEAVELGFADQIEQPIKLAALFDIDQRHASAPEDLKEAAVWDRVIAKTNTQFYGGALV